MVSVAPCESALARGHHGSRAIADSARFATGPQDAVLRGSRKIPPKLPICGDQSWRGGNRGASAGGAAAASSAPARRRRRGWRAGGRRTRCRSVQHRGAREFCAAKTVSVSEVQMKAMAKPQVSLASPSAPAARPAAPPPPPMPRPPPSERCSSTTPISAQRQDEVDDEDDVFHGRARLPCGLGAYLSWPMSSSSAPSGATRARARSSTGCPSAPM
jgi:hypothetical protein